MTELSPSYDRCPTCGGSVSMEKSTVTGDEIREYHCETCGWSEWVNRGPALWRILSDADEPHDEQ